MLLSFRFANHRSFRDEQQLNLTPAYRSDEHEQAVRVVGVFGANASGKSNCLDALGFMRRKPVNRGVAVGTDATRVAALLDQHEFADVAVSGRRGYRYIGEMASIMDARTPRGR
ncbi:hypothetical protein O7631_11575 [Micromonospora sp. WMMD967]|uniref:AAA family ATPase n=1 Tax=Micromonospora sp. WMMD967 TaxID=3016101 RepID=UPI0024178E29|nr:hypothetical protein [Micromonospora sp. WMMD967]MDG4837155.1 hypothetical protein [Micromonospora sp. WMMD967]